MPSYSLRAMQWSEWRKLGNNKGNSSTHFSSTGSGEQGCFGCAQETFYKRSKTTQKLNEKSQNAASPIA